MLYLRNATFVDWRTLRMRRGHLAVEPGPAGAVRFTARVPRGARALDCSGRLVTKSFVIAHHHLYSALALGMPFPARVPRTFVETLQLIWWNLDRALDTDMIRASALAGGIEAAKCGATFIIDHHSSPNAVRGSLDVIAAALDEIGLSHLLCVELSDRDGAASSARSSPSRKAQVCGGLTTIHAILRAYPALPRRDLRRARSLGLCPG